jgi:SPP1 family predicted phage head-tail adaptor
MAALKRPIGAGDFDQRIVIEQPSSGVDVLGQRVETWSTLATVWAQAQPLRGREYFAAGQTQSEADVRFRIRYRTDVNSAMRVQWRSVPHAIVAPPMDVDGQQHTLELMCATGVRDTR